MTTATVKDPVCGMEVKASSAGPHSEYKGQTYSFCCSGCKGKFDHAPARYTGNLQPRRRVTRAAVAAVSVCLFENSGGLPPHNEELLTSTMSPPSAGPAPPAGGPVQYTCPMHPQIVRDAPGNCPICGMTLEPRAISADKQDNPELRDMTRRFWVSLGLALPVLVSAMSGGLLRQFAPARFWTWFELILATPVVLWGGWPFFVRAWQSLVSRSLNMFTLVGLGVGVAYGYSLIAALLPGIFPASFRDETGGVAVYFEAAAMITTLVLLGRFWNESAKPDRSRNPCSSRPCPQNGPSRGQGRLGVRFAAGTGKGGRPSPRAPRRKGPRRWGCAGRHEQR